MGITHQHKLWLLGQAVAKESHLADPRRWGGLPFELQKYRRIMPVLMHGKHITFANMQTKHSHSRRPFIPNIIYRPLFSHSLNMQIWTCLSARALREIDARGGLDEYMMSVGEEKFGNDSVALMYRKKIAEASQKQQADASSLKNRMMNLMRERYGRDYLEKVSKLQNL
jgi:ribosomal protein L28